VDSIFVHTDLARDGIASLVIDRPKRRNALNLMVKRQLVAAIDACEQDDRVKAIILSGANGVFVAGTDIAEMKDMQPGSHAESGTGVVFEKLRACSKLLLAAVEGFALGGGCELALACDLVVAAETAKFGLPEIRVGIMPGAGGTQMLLRAAGKHRTLRLVLTGDMICAAEALDLGIVSEVVGSGLALDRAIALATQINAMPPLAVRAIRDCVAMGLDSGLSGALAYERRSFELLFASGDQREGMQAFLDKRSPQYTGN
jgi:enoyl-CoA hydratase/carnithine racemase